MQTQWRVGLAGREGLDYPGVMVYLEKVAGLRRKAFTQAFGGIAAMERAALDEWAKQRSND